MTDQLDLFDPDAKLEEWVGAQLYQLGLKPGDELYDGARQAAERGWPASAIRPLIWPAAAIERHGDGE